MSQTAVKENFEFVRGLKQAQNLSFKQLTELTGYSDESVRAWFSDHGSSKYRPVPDRAVTILKLKLDNKKSA